MTKRILIQFLFLFIALTAFTQDIPLNENYSIACHNCYLKKPGTSIEDVFQYTSNIEIDIYDSKFFMSKKNRLSGDWYVRHNPFFARTANNCCGGTFKDCLLKIKAWSERNPMHGLITVFIDKKEKWNSISGQRTPADLDQLLRSVFPGKEIFTPADLKGNATSLSEVIQNNTWPGTDAVKGKIAFFVTDSRFFGSRNKLLDDYTDARQQGAVCFVAPEIKKEKEIAEPHGISEKNRQFIVCYNLGHKKEYLISAINNRHYLIRLFGGDETPERLNLLKRQKVNFIAIDNYTLH